jgi:hypothetical protein
MGTPVAVPQTTDGYLWIGTTIGLVRFDGMHFTPWSFEHGQRLSDPRVFSLVGGSDGSLWIGTGSGIDRLKGGELTHYPQVSGRIESVLQDAAGTVWLVRTQATDGQGPLCSIRSHDQVRCYGTANGISFSLAIQVKSASADELWIAGYNEICRWTAKSSTTYFTHNHKSPETFASLKGIATGVDGSEWAAIDRSTAVFQLQHFEHGKWLKRDFTAIKEVEKKRLVNIKWNSACTQRGRRSSIHGRDGARATPRTDSNQTLSQRT